MAFERVVVNVADRPTDEISSSTARAGETSPGELRPRSGEAGRLHLRDANPSTGRPGPPTIGDKEALRLAAAAWLYWHDVRGLALDPSQCGDCELVVATAVRMAKDRKQLAVAA